MPGSQPWWVSQTCSVLATLALLSLCFEVAFDSVCGREEYVFVKEVTGFSVDSVSEEARLYDAQSAATQPRQALAVAVAVNATPDAPPAYEDTGILHGKRDVMPPPSYMQ